MSHIRRSVMTLFSNGDCPHSHRVRLVLAEKAVTVDVISVDPDHPSDELLAANPYNLLPTLVDRDLVLYHSGIIMEYLDERFPHPPLLPVYPVARAKQRLTMHHIEKDWYPLIETVATGNKAAAEKARKEIGDSLTSLAAVFADSPFFLSEDFSLVDCSIAPLLWRLPSLEVTLPNRAKAVLEYADRIFARESFQTSLTEAERELRD